MPELFAVGTCHTNDEIAGALGSTNQNYVRTITGNRVVALCLNAWEHPRAPSEVWVGSGGAKGLIGRSAQWLVEQYPADAGAGVPLFIKDIGSQGGERSWCYHGRYRVLGDTRDEAALAAVRALRKAPVARIVYLERVSD